MFITAYSQIVWLMKLMTKSYPKFFYYQEKFSQHTTPNESVKCTVENELLKYKYSKITTDFQHQSHCTIYIELLQTSIGKKKNWTTTDNGSNIINTVVDHLKLIHMPCINHTLQLSICSILIGREQSHELI